jgi:hypothetical protein
MPSFSEANKVIKISIGLLITIVGATFFVTKFYISQITLEDRQIKQYDRLDKRIHDIEERLYEDEKKDS